MNISDPLVSVIIPTHNRKTLLKAAVQSVLDQTYKNFEIIIFDNGSTDGTDHLIKNWNHPQMIYHWQEDTGGPSSPRNKGIKLAKGKYVAFLDSDDLWLAKKLEKQLTLHETDDEVKLTFTNSGYIGAQSNTLKGNFFSTYKPHRGFVFKEYLNSTFIPLSTAMVEKNILNDVGLFSLKYIVAQDYDFFLRIVKKFKVDFCNEELCLFRSHSLSLGQAGVTLYKDIFDIYSIWKHSGDLNPEELQIVKKRRKKFDFQTAVQLLKSEKDIEAMILLSELKKENQLAGKLFLLYSYLNLEKKIKIKRLFDVYILLVKIFEFLKYRGVRGVVKKVLCLKNKTVL